MDVIQSAILPTTGVFYYPTQVAEQGQAWCGIGGWAHTSVVVVDPTPGGTFTLDRSSTVFQTSSSTAAMQKACTT